MSSILIGHTGFVGGFLATQRRYDLHISRANLSQLAHQRCERIVCAGLPAAKWLANREPEADLANLHTLCGALETVQAEQFVLISTIDVYPFTRDADETFDCGKEPNHAYGRHRFQFEQFVRQRFPQATIIRLPALFGPGLKKNVIFDLLHDNGLDVINPASSFQWYPLCELPTDIERIERAALPLVNLFPEPIVTAEILQRFFPEKAVGARAGAQAHYDLWTRHAEYLGGPARYAMRKSQVLDALANYLANYLNKHEPDRQQQ